MGVWCDSSQFERLEEGGGLARSPASACLGSCHTHGSGDGLSVGFRCRWLDWIVLVIVRVGAGA
jgi:hypothetical protein